MKRTAELQKTLATQMATLQQTGDQLLRQLREDLDAQLSRL